MTSAPTPKTAAAVAAAVEVIELILFPLPQAEIWTTVSLLWLQLLKSVNSPLKLGVVCNRLAAVGHYTGIVELCLSEARKCDPHDLAHHFYSQGEQPEDTQGMQAYITR